MRLAEALLLGIAGAVWAACPRQYSCDSVAAFSWPSKVPADSPLAESKSTLGFTGEYCSPNIEYLHNASCFVNADTWYPVMGSDGMLWSSFTDGVVDGVSSGSGGSHATTGWAVLDGFSAEKGFAEMQVTRVGTTVHSAAPLGGRYPCASFSVNGTWYYGTYGLDNGPRTTSPGKKRVCGRNGWCIGGPFVGFHLSGDQGRTWSYGPNVTEMDAGATNLFRQWPWPADDQPFQFRIMQPHFVDHGKNNIHSPDGYAYLVTHGCDPKLNSPEAYCGWIQGSQIYLLRIRDVTPARINDPASYEFYAGGEGANARWSSSMADMAPLVNWEDHTGVTNVVYVSQARRYLMFVSFPSANGWSNSTMDSWVAESETITGPWRLVSYWEKFGTQAYFLNSPSVSWSGTTGWLWYSAMYAVTPGVTPNPPFCQHTPGRGNCYGSVLSRVVYTPH